MIRGQGVCDECWLGVPELDRLTATRYDTFSDTHWEYMLERAEQRRGEEEAIDYYRRLNDPP